MNVLIVNSSGGYDRLFRKLGHTLVYDESKADFLVFTGGEDVTPAFYGAKKHESTHNSTYRDVFEEGVFQRNLDKPKVGICRGGQFLNVMSGGEMYQDVGKHCGAHEITDLLTGETLLVSSTHHQMMKPSHKGLLVASAGLGGSRVWYEGTILKKDVSKEDIEVVYYEHTNSLCFQPHPEFENEIYHPMQAYFAKCLERYLDVQVEELV